MNYCLDSGIHFRVPIKRIGLRNGRGNIEGIEISLNETLQFEKVIFPQDAKSGYNSSNRIVTRKPFTKRDMS